MIRRVPKASLKCVAHAVLILLSTAIGAAHAAEIDTGNPDVKVRWDNTFKYTFANRLNDADQAVAVSAANPNVDFGDLGKKAGQINSRIDLLSELDVNVNRQYGFRLSGTAWYDESYQNSNTAYPTAGMPPNNVAAALGGANNHMSESARQLMGNSGEISDAFVYGSTDLGGDMKLSGRAGRFTQLYGESLFLGANGIAAAQGPVDLIKAYSVPNSQFKEIGMPVGQVSGNLQVNSNLSFGAYYQYEWRPLRLPAAGSYFSPADFVGEGADLLLLPGGPANRIADKKGDDTGQYGMRTKFKMDGSDVEYGLYFANYHEKAPIPVVNVTDPGAFGSGTYQLMYQKNVKMYGASFSTLVGETNVAGEISTRQGTPLSPLGDLIINFNPLADNSGNSPYALGNTLHMNLSAISVFPGNALYDGASIVGELAFNRLLEVTHNPTNPAFTSGVLNTTHTQDAWAMRVLFQPEYFQVLPGLDMQVPIGVGYGISGRSAVIQIAPEGGGDVSVGFNFEYQKTWRAGLQFMHYFGPAGPAPSMDPAINTFASYKQYYADRDYVSFSIQRTF